MQPFSADPDNKAWRSEDAGGALKSFGAISKTGSIKSSNAVQQQQNQAGS